MGNRASIAGQDGTCPSGFLPENGCDIHCIEHHASPISTRRTDRPRGDLLQVGRLPIPRHGEPTDATDSVRILRQAQSHGVNGLKAKCRVQTLSS